MHIREKDFYEAYFEIQRVTPESDCRAKIKLFRTLIEGVKAN